MPLGLVYNGRAFFFADTPAGTPADTPAGTPAGTQTPKIGCDGSFVVVHEVRILPRPVVVGQAGENFWFLGEEPKAYFYVFVGTVGDVQIVRGL